VILLPENVQRNELIFIFKSPRAEPGVKEQAKNIMEQPGLSASVVINLLFNGYFACILLGQS